MCFCMAWAMHRCSGLASFLRRCVCMATSFYSISAEVYRGDVHCCIHILNGSAVSQPQAILEIHGFLGVRATLGSLPIGKQKPLRSQLVEPHPPPALGILRGGAEYHHQLLQGNEKTAAEGCRGDWLSRRSRSGSSGQAPTYHPEAHCHVCGRHGCTWCSQGVLLHGSAWGLGLRLFKQRTINTTVSLLANSPCAKNEEAWLHADFVTTASCKRGL